MELLKTKKQCNNILKSAGINDYVNNTNILCEHVLKVSKSELFCNIEISEKNHKKIIFLAKKRASGIPLQYIVGYVFFFNNKIYVNKNVLIPRNETEQLLEIVSLHLYNNCKVLDLCSGSGCIGLGLKKFNENLFVTLCDISKKALYVAKKNAKANNLKVNFRHSDLFQNVKGKFNIIVSNPPYIKEKDLQTLSVEVQNEPQLALNGKTDGLWYYKKIIENAPKFLENNGEIFFECGIKQAYSVAKYLEKNFECIKIIKDYYGINRFVYAKLKENIC